MKKKVIALTLSAVLALSSTSAFAAVTEPSNCTNTNLDYNNLLKNYVSKFKNSNYQFKVTLNGKTINLNDLNNKPVETQKPEVTKPVETQKPEVKQPEIKEPEVKVPAPEVKQPEVKEPVAKVPTPEAPAKDTVSSSNLNYEQKVVELVNVERQKAGLPALKLDSQLSNVARLKSKDMATNNYFAHQSPTYGSAGDMLTKHGIKWSAWGENIAYGQNTPEIVVNAWMNSPGHRANILSSNFGKIGVGYVVNSNGRPYWTQVFTN